MVPPASHRIPRARWYSGSSPLASTFAYETLTPSGALSQVLRLPSARSRLSATPSVFLPMVWPLARSLATTCAISCDFSSSAYLDVSVRQVPSLYLCVQHRARMHVHTQVPPFGYLRIVAHLQLPAAFRSLSRPSLAPSAKASTLRSS